MEEEGSGEDAGSKDASGEDEDEGKEEPSVLVLEDSTKVQLPVGGTVMAGDNIWLVPLPTMS